MKQQLTFLLSQSRFTLPASSRSARPSSRGSAIKVNLLRLFAVWDLKKKKEQYVLSRDLQLLCLLYLFKQENSPQQSILHCLFQQQSPEKQQLDLTL